MRRPELAAEHIRLASVAVELPAAEARLHELVWPLLLAVASAAAIMPLWCSELLPFQDMPQHLAAVRVLADFHSPASGFDRWFDIDLMRLQYLGFYLPAAGLAKLVGPDAACRILLSAIALVLPASFWMFLGAFGRDRRLAVFAPAVFHTLPLYMGFFNYIESVPAALAVVALTERQLRNPGGRRAIGIAAAAAALLWLHPSALAFALAAAALLAATSGQPLRRARAAVLPFLPALALFALWAIHAALARDGAGNDAHTAPRWLPLTTRLMDIARFGNVLAGHADEVFVLALGATFAAAAVAGRGAPGNRAFRIPLLAGATMLAYLAAPFDAGYMSWIGHRALPFVALLVLASPVLAPRRSVSAICGLAVALQIAYGAVLVHAFRAFDREAQVPALEQVLSAAEPGKRLIAQIWDQESAFVHFRPYMHFGAYYEVWRGGRALFNFAETPWTPVRFRPGTEPAAMPRGWEWYPERLEPGRDNFDDEYLLLRAPGRDPGDDFTLRESAGRWTLYERRFR